MYEDLADLCHRDKSAEIAARFQKNWDYELQQVGSVHAYNYKSACAYLRNTGMISLQLIMHISTIISEPKYSANIINYSVVFITFKALPVLR